MRFMKIFWTFVLTFFILVNFALSQTNSTNSSLDLQSPSIEILSPKQNAILSTLSPTINFTITDNVALQDCSYTVDSSPIQTLNCNETSLTLPMNEGQHTIVFYAKDTSNNTAEATLTFTLDVTPPSITSYDPTNRVLDKNQFSLNVRTSEKAICKFDFIQRDFSSMSYSLSTEDNLLHTYPLNLDEGTYNLSILCKDLAGNLMQSAFNINFEVNLAPFVRHIVIKDAVLDGDTFLLKPGFYEVQLELSEPVSSIDLYYTLQTSFTKNKISLVGSGTNWKGYFMIPSSSSNNVGSFQVNLKDLSGKTGNEIKDGNIFIIDSVPPSEVSDFKVKKVTSNNVVLAWYYLPKENDFAKFKIYRSEEKDVSYVDFYVEVSKDVRSYTDVNVEEGKTYYYRIAAVDKAGNEGPLSKEIEVKIPKKQENVNALNDTTNTSVEVNAKGLDKIREVYSLVEQKLLEVQWADRQLNSLQDSELTSVSQILELSSNIEAVRKNLDAIKKQLDDILNAPKAGVDYALIAKSLKSKVELYAGSLPKEVVIEDKQELLQDLSSSDIEYISNFIVNRYSSLDSKLKERYLNDNLDILSNLKIIATYYKVKVKLFDESVKQYVVVKKKVISKEPLNVVQVVEDIDNSFVPSLSKINFKDNVKVISDQELMVAKDFSNFNEYELIYWAESSKLSAAKLSKTYLVKNPSYLEQMQISQGSSVSGMATFDVSSISLDSLIVLLFLAVLALGAYYYSSLKLGSKTRQDPKRLNVDLPKVLLKESEPLIVEDKQIPILLEKATLNLVPINTYNFNYARGLVNNILKSMSEEAKKKYENHLLKTKAKFAVANQVLIGHSLVDKKDHIALTLLIRELESALDKLIPQLDLDKERAFIQEVTKHINYFKRMRDALDPFTTG